MNILSIETSCDETAISLIEARGGLTEPVFNVLGNALFSQVALHEKYGGVFPTLAKREHAKNLPPLLVDVLKQSSQYKLTQKEQSEKIWGEIEKILEKEEGLYDTLKKNIEHIDKPNIDVIAVTEGPGLEPCLWVGISFAKALGLLWHIPVIGVNHMEGHILSVFFEKNKLQKTEFPTLALLISGGHTELVFIKEWGQYQIVGQTRDDAVGECFDKVARILGLPYPGGPEISKLAEQAENLHISRKAKLPRPMIHSNNLDFSFSGLKTAVLYYVRDHPNLSPDDKMDIAREFQEAVIEVLIEKTKQAIEQTASQTLIIGGGVVSNKQLKEKFFDLEKIYNGLSVYTPTPQLSKDNALMIGLAGYMRIIQEPDILTRKKDMVAQGNLRLSSYIVHNWY